MKIRIIRGKESFARFKDLDVYIDGKRAGSVSYNSKKDFVVSDEEHEVYVKEGIIQSDVYRLRPSKLVALEVSFPSSIIDELRAYTIDRNNAIRLRSIRDDRV